MRRRCTRYTNTRLEPTNPSASQVISSARRSTPNQKRSFAGIRRLFSSSPGRKAHSAYRPTTNKINDGPACRVYGSVAVKKVTGNLHITTLGHGYMSMEHTDHGRESLDLSPTTPLKTVMNLSHIVHEFSFGPYFPAIAQPLDMTYEKTDQRE